MPFFFELVVIACLLACMVMNEHVCLFTYSGTGQDQDRDQDQDQEQE